MLNKFMFGVSPLLLIAIVVLLRLATVQASAPDVILYASEATTKVGNWQVVTDATAAGGARLQNADLGGAKLAAPLPVPASYFEITFNAESHIPYRLWIRGKAQNDSPYNDSVFVQFDGSVDANGTAVFRTGTTDGTCINLEEASGYGLSGWGWQDNGWGVGVMGPTIYFASTGTQTLRLQPREDGLSIDQIVLSPATYLNAAPGALKNDTTILPKNTATPPPPSPPPAGTPEIVIWASDVSNSSVHGSFAKAFDATAAGTTALHNPDAGGAKLATALSNPATYFDVSFNAQSNTAYHLWIHGKADGNSPYNDSFFIQFSGSVDANGSAVFRTGTTDSTCVNIEEASGYGLSGWGWQDNGWGVGVMGSNIYFASSGTQTLRIQPREDGFSIDQIVLSPAAYLNTSPGALKNDSTILPSTLGGGTSAPPPPVNQPPVVSVSATPVSGVAPLPVSFNTTASDPDGSIASYSWNFGDGQTSTQPFPSHTYSNSGTYTARLTVTDNQGATASASVVITANAPSSGGATFRVMTWNSQGGNGTDNIHNLDRQATWLANMGADIVAMCESYRFGGDDQPQLIRDLLSQKTGVQWSFYWIGKFPGCLEGNVILTKWPVVSSSSQYLSVSRSILQATINVNGKLVNFFATHLDPDSTSARQQEMTELMTFAGGFAEPRIICGDFNASPDWPEIPTMTLNYYDGWNQAFGAGTATAYPDNPVEWQTRTRRGRIDYVFYSRGAGNLTLNSMQIPDTRDLSRSPSESIGTTDDRGVRPSDHNPSVATFSLR